VGARRPPLAPSTKRPLSRNSRAPAHSIDKSFWAHLASFRPPSPAHHPADRGPIGGARRGPEWRTCLARGRKWSPRLDFGAAWRAEGEAWRSTEAAWQGRELVERVSSERQAWASAHHGQTRVAQLAWPTGARLARPTDFVRPQSGRVWPRVAERMSWAAEMGRPQRRRRSLNNKTES